MRILIVLGVALSTCGVAYACICIDVGFDKQFELAQAVFLAKVTSISDTEWGLEVERTWKGDVPKTIRIRDSLAKTDCSMRFGRDVRYIFFASRRGTTDIFYTNGCIEIVRATRTSGFLLVGLGIAVNLWDRLGQTLGTLTQLPDHA
jgi:hypothetical protein